MTYSDAIKTAYTDVNASALDKIKAMMKNYGDVKKQLSVELNELYASLAGIEPKEWYNTAIKIDRLQSLMKSVSVNYAKYSALANTQTQNLITDSMKDMYYRTQFIHAAFIPGGISLTVLPDKLIQAAVTGQAEAIKSITQGIIDRYGSLSNYTPKYGTLSGLLADRDMEAVSSIEKAVTQSLIKGDGIKTLTDTISDTFDTIGWKAARIAQSESMRVESAGQWAQTRDLEAEDIQVQKMWMHVMTDEKHPRPDHEDLDGTIIDTDEEFKDDNSSGLYPHGFDDPASNINCKCTYINVINGVTPQTRTATDPVTGEKSIFSFETYNEWRDRIAS